LLAFYKYRLDRSRFGTAATVNAQRLAVNRRIHGRAAVVQHAAGTRAACLEACAALRSGAQHCIALHGAFQRGMRGGPIPVCCIARRLPGRHGTALRPARSAWDGLRGSGAVYACANAAAGL
jgi:hypothetical protein